MKTAILLLTALVSASLIASEAFAFTCPKLVKAASESIAKAESAAARIADEREKGRAMAMIELANDLTKQAEADHKEAGAKKEAGLHYRSEAKAKAAKALVDMVK